MMLTAIEEIKKVDPEYIVSETIYDNSDHGENIDGDATKVEVFDELSDISRLINDSEKILKVDGESRDQTNEEADIEVSISNEKTDSRIFERFEAAKKSTEEIKKRI